VRKSFFFAVAGAGLIFAGCQDHIMGEHRYHVIPVDDPYQSDVQPSAPSRQNTVAEPFAAPQPQPAFPAAKQPEQRQTAAVKYEPMVDAVSSGGVDSPAPAKVKKAQTPASGTVAPGGTYIVKRGDTPERIARKHRVRLSALMSANNLDDASARKLQVGQKLIIPGKDTAVAPAKAAKPAAKAADTAAAPATLENGKYKVRSGDTLERIARKFKVKLKDLLTVNNLNEESSRRLQIGQELIIPGKSVGSDPKPETVTTDAAGNQLPASAPAVKTDNGQQPVTETTATDNQATTKTVTDYVLVETEAETTYAEFAKKHGVSEEALREMNDADSSATVIPAQTLVFVPKQK
jgi:LysM repeat protein